MAGHSQRLGILCEDRTDFDALRVLVRRMRPGLGCTPRLGDGAAKLRKKAAAWMRDLARDDVRNVVIVHDLDRKPGGVALNDLPALTTQLTDIAVPVGMKRVVCVPVEELEAWFWSSPAVLSDVARRPQKARTEPHRIARPKEELMRLSRDAGGRARYSTNDNARLAELLELDLCTARCPAFAVLRSFVEAI